jgi:WD40 repeat protein
MKVAARSASADTSVPQPAIGRADEISMIARLAFRRADRTPAELEQIRHLALLSKETLELDLSDPAQRQFGDYELQELIGEGGMGVVYRARQLSLDRDVAVKLLAAGPWASRDFVERFRAEAQNAARMQHPNIVAIYEVGDVEELHFFSMRLIHGPSLAAEIKREGRIGSLRAARLLRTIAEAVDYAHRLGVLHLDLKPANVLIDEDGTPHVADFGLARRLEQGLAADNNEVSGTPSYMAPEQTTAGAQKITAATDIWGLGAILYELVTGLPPFLGVSPQATLKLVVEGQVRSPRRYVPDLPCDLEAIILKCMAHDAADRYATARALADDLARFAEGRAVRARPLNAMQQFMRWTKREPKLAATALLALLALLAGLAATTQQWRRADLNAQRAEQQRQLAENNATTSTQRLWESRRDSALRLMEDGKGFEALTPLIANIEEKEQAGRIDPASIERHEIGMIMSQGVTLIDRMIIADANPMATALSPDGSLLAVALNDISVRWYETATLTEKGRVDLSGLPTSARTDGVPLLLRFVDNHRLLVTAQWFTFMPSPSYGDTYLVDLDNAEVIMPPPAFAGLVDTVFSTDGRHALVRNDHRKAQLWHVEPWRPLSRLVDDASSNAQPYWLLDPKLRFAFKLGQNNGIVNAFDPLRLTGPRALTFPAHETFSAWSESADGKQLALGASNGQVFMVDLASLKVRQLPSPIGSEVRWLSFSEDDAWLAVARREGAAFAFDVASGEPLQSGQMQHDFELTHIELSRRDRLVIASGAGNCALWRLPEQGPGGRDAARILASPTHSARAGEYWTSTSLQAGLLATADMDGEVRLWRLPRPTKPEANSPGLISGSLYFDGTHVVDVDYDALRIVSVSDRSASPWLPLPPPIAFAELVAGGKRLIAVARTTLHILDATTLQPQQVPFELRGTPQRLVASAGGDLVALSFGHNGPAGFEEHVEVYDLTAGRRREGQIVVKGPLRQLELSADASRLLTTGSRDGATEVFDTATLKRLGSYVHDSTRPVLWAAFTADATQLWLVTRSMDDTQGDNAGLIRWDPATGSMRERREVSGVWPVGIATVGDKPLLAARDRLVLDPGATDERVAAGLHGGEATTVFAVSHDRRLIANAFDRDINLYDAATLARVGPALHTDMHSYGELAQLAFADDDRHLLARSANLNSGWRVWPLSADDRPAADLRADSELLTPHVAGPRVLRVAEPDERANLRRQDLGAWPIPEMRRQFPSERLIGGEPLPARDRQAGPLLLDLGESYNMAPSSMRSMMDSVIPSIGHPPLGVARIDGVDYDLRGALELRDKSGGTVGSRFAMPLGEHATGIRAPPVAIAALHVLLYAPVAVPTDQEGVYASLRLHYRDGSRALLPMRTQRELPGWTDHDRPVPVGWIDGDHLRLIGAPLQGLISNPRLVNPHPERLIATIDLETADTGWSTPVFFAVTAEPVIADDNGRILKKSASE